jgi:uracil-DNA glycosylase
MTDLLAPVRAYVSQQIELGMPDIVFPPGSPAARLLVRKPLPAQPAHRSPAPPVPKTSAAPVARPRLLPALHLVRAAEGKPAPAARNASDPVRQALVELYESEKNCYSCGLAGSRTKFVFGSGNAHARIMVVGEAPGADEDAQGLPFVGAAGAMLTKMLAAIGLDRSKDVFITNILKCRPPENRTPEATEVDACKHILLSQIGIIKPQVFLLLGKVAAHAVLGLTDSITALRKEVRSVDGVPAFVTYHPAALLHNPDYRKPAWEDLKKLRTFLAERGIHAAAN